MKFEPGNNRNPAGRPKGSKDNKQFSLTYWFNIIVEQYPHLTANQRASIALECWKKLIDKSKSIPASPEASNLNASALLLTLKQAEEGTIVNTDDVKINKA